jgi:hypothetical protein
MYIFLSYMYNYNINSCVKIFDEKNVYKTISIK